MAPDPHQMDERLDEVEEHIDSARRQAEDHGNLPPSEPEPTFLDADADGEIDDDEPGTPQAP